MMSRMAKEAVIEYLERPTTDDERLIAALLEKAMRASNTQNFETLLSVYTDDALIMPAFSKEKVHVAKERYAAIVRAWALGKGSFAFKDVSIRVAQNQSEAEAFGILCALFSRDRNGRPRSVGRHFLLKKRGAEWRIVKASDA